MTVELLKQQDIAYLVDAAGKLGVVLDDKKLSWPVTRIEMANSLWAQNAVAVGRQAKAFTIIEELGTWPEDVDVLQVLMSCSHYEYHTAQATGWNDSKPKSFLEALRSACLGIACRDKLWGSPDPISIVDVKDAKKRAWQQGDEESETPKKRLWEKASTEDNKSTSQVMGMRK